MKTHALVTMVALLCALLTQAALAGEKPGELREFNPDRPDRTEGPFTVDPGHFQLEADIVSYTHDRSFDGTATTAQGHLSFANVNLKIGMTNSLDFEVIQEFYHRTLTSVEGVESSLHGLGDTTLRVKFNYLGNDGGPIALGLLPFIKLPTSSGGVGNNSVEGGLLLPVSLSLPHEFNLGFMMGYDQVRDALDSQLHTEFVSSASLSRAIGWGFESYVELYSQTSNELGAAWAATADTGLIYSVTKELKLDAGVNVGVTDAADDLNFFAGVATRF